MKLGLLFSELAERAGIDTTSEEFKAVLGIGTEIPDETASQFKSNLMDLNAAKANPDLKKYFHAQALDGIDRHMIDLLSKTGFADEDLTEIKSQLKTQQKLEKAIEKLKTKAEEEGKKKYPDNEAIKKLNDQIAELNKKNAEILQSKESELNSLREQFESERLNEALSSKFLTKQWSEAFPEDLRKDISDIAFKKFLADNSAIIKRGEKGLQLVQKDSPETPLYIENKPVQLDEAIEMVFTQNKFLKTVPTNEPPTHGRSTPPNPQDPKPLPVNQAISKMLYGGQ